MLDRYVNGHHTDNVDEFCTAWFQPTSFNHFQAMSDIWYEHGELKCCVGIRGNIDGDPLEQIDIADIVYLIDYSFNLPPGPAPPCMEEADVNGDGDIDIADIVYLIDYSFNNPPGPTPLGC